MMKGCLYTSLALALSALACICSSSGLSTFNDRMLDENGNTLVLRGANWFGFNNGATMVDGLWTTNNGFTYDFATIVYRWQLLGFNAIRLPFSMQDLYNRAPQNKQSSCTLPSFTQVAYSVTDPADNVPAGLNFPQPVAWPTHAAGACNGYLPSDSTLNRFVWVAQYLARSGFYVIIDDHTEDPTVANNRAQFVSNWVDIVTRISQDTIARERLIVDILNEPDARGWGWDTMGALYLTVMDAVYPVNNKVLFFIEGCGQGGVNGANWGDGFQTSGVSGAYSNPNPFFQTLFSKAYLNQVVISPHIYGPSVTYANSNYFGAGLWNRMTNSFGYLTTTGYTYNGATKRFPVVIGETGSKFQNAGDMQFLQDLKAYLLNTGSAAAYSHNAMPSIIWWSWNDNSGDTGGLIDGSWFNLIWVKIQYLRSLGLTPWYLGAVPGSSPSPSPLPSASPSPAIVASPSPSPSPSVLPSSPSPSPNPSGSSCRARFAYYSSWNTNLGVTTSMNIYVSNLGPSEVAAGWTFTMYHPSYAGLAGSTWSFKYLGFAGQTFSGIADQGWQVLRVGGQEVNIGLILASSSGSFLPTSFKVNGVDCSVAAA